MSQQRTPRAGHPVASKTVKRLKRAGGIVTAVALGTSFMAFVPLSAQADTGVSTYGQGNFLNGTVGGINLDDLVALQSATARNDGSQTTVTESNPLSASVLNGLLNVGTDAPLNVNLNDALGITANTGVLHQVAVANNDGTASAGSGAVGSDGAITTGDPSGSGSAAVDLDGLLGTNFASVVANLQLQLDAISASATGSSDAVSGAYRLDGAHLSFTSPALAGVTDRVNAALAPVISALDTAQSNLGGVGLTGLNINGGELANVSATATLSLSGAQLQSAVDDILTGSYGSGGINVDLGTGAVTIDLAALQGGSLNDKPVDYELLSDAAIQQILSGVTNSVSTVVSDVTSKVNELLGGVSANVALHADVLGLSVLNPVTAPVTNGLGSLLGGLGLGALAPQASEVDALATVDAHVSGSVSAILGGTGTANATLTIAGATLPIDVSPVLGAVTNALGGLNNTGDLVTQVGNLLSSTLTTPVANLVGTDDGGASLTTILSDLLSIRLNHQYTRIGTGGLAVPENTLFTETAVNVRVLQSVGATGNGLATVNLANATVGPNQTGTSGNPGDPGNPGGPGTPGNPGGPGTGGTAGGTNNSTPTASHSSSLAYTGVGIATIIAVILALLAAGAYLAREGYRRKHMAQL